MYIMKYFHANWCNLGSEILILVVALLWAAPKMVKAYCGVALLGAIASTSAFVPPSLPKMEQVS